MEYRGDTLEKLRRCAAEAMPLQDLDFLHDGWESFTGSPHGSDAFSISVDGGCASVVFTKDMGHATLTKRYDFDGNGYAWKPHSRHPMEFYRRK